MYGSVVPVRARDPTKFQHQGFGMLLMEEAERISLEEHKSTKIAVISGLCISHKQQLNFCQAINSLMYYTVSVYQKLPSLKHQKSVMLLFIGAINIRIENFI